MTNDDISLCDQLDGNDISASLHNPCIQASAGLCVHSVEHVLEILHLNILFQTQV